MTSGRSASTCSSASLPVARPRDAIALRLEDVADGVEDVGVVVDDQHERIGSWGRGGRRAAEYTLAPGERQGSQPPPRTTSAPPSAAAMRRASGSGERPPVRIARRSLHRIARASASSAAAPDDGERHRLVRRPRRRRAPASARAPATATSASSARSRSPRSASTPSAGSTSMRHRPRSGRRSSTASSASRARTGSIRSGRPPASSRSQRKWSSTSWRTRAIERRHMAESFSPRAPPRSCGGHAREQLRGPERGRERVPDLVGDEAEVRSRARRPRRAAPLLVAVAPVTLSSRCPIRSMWCPQRRDPEPRWPAERPSARGCRTVPACVEGITAKKPNR